ncbi:MAG: hypothetical protein LAO22_14630 [Acidobacteriia bacterium]|nr:hypothetical protein [Terriglobia bacterium]
MSNLPTNQVLVSILQMLKEQAIFAHRQQGWITALWETIERDDELQSRLKQHPRYDQGPQPNLQRIDVLTRNIDALIQRLKH